MGYLASSRGGYAYRYSRARGGFLSGLVSGIGRVASTVGRVASVVPGLGVLGTVASAAGGVIQRAGGTQSRSLAMPGGMPILTMAGSVGRPAPGITGALQRAIPGGASGFLRSRRMNAGNAKAARRAIRRIKAVRKLLQGIERELPRRPAARSSRGVITRSEAARALRS
jgi:hypothetical protein